MPGKRHVHRRECQVPGWPRSRLTKKEVPTLVTKLSHDPEFRKMLGPEFEAYSDDELEIILDAIFETIRERVEELERAFPIVPGLAISV